MSKSLCHYEPTSPFDVLSDEKLKELWLSEIIEYELPQDKEFYNNNEEELVFDLVKFNYLEFPIVINKLAEWRKLRDETIIPEEKEEMISNLKKFCECLISRSPRGRPRKVNPLRVAIRYREEYRFWREFSEKFRKLKKTMSVFKAINEIKKIYPMHYCNKIDNYYNDIPSESSILSLKDEFNCEPDTIRKNLQKGRKILEKEIRRWFPRGYNHTNLFK